MIHAEFCLCRRILFFECVTVRKYIRTLKTCPYVCCSAQLLFVALENCFDRMHLPLLEMGKARVSVVFSSSFLQLFVTLIVISNRLRRGEGCERGRMRVTNVGSD